jgi:hypothetical protein
MRTIKEYNTQRMLRNIVVSLDSGLVFLPYIEPVTLVDNQLIGISSRYASSRYASVQVNPNNYGVVNLPNVNGRIFV